MLLRVAHIHQCGTVERSDVEDTVSNMTIPESQCSRTVSIRLLSQRTIKKYYMLQIASVERQGALIEPHPSDHCLERRF